MLLARIVKTPTGSQYKGEGRLRVAFREKVACDINACNELYIYMQSCMHIIILGTR